MSLDLEKKLASLERDFSQMSGFFDRLDKTMEKLTDISSSIKELLAVHEVRINQTSDKLSETTLMIEKRKDYIDGKHQSLFEKVGLIENQLRIFKYFFWAISMLIGFLLFKTGVIPYFSAPL